MERDDDTGQRMDLDADRGEGCSYTTEIRARSSVVQAAQSERRFGDEPEVEQCTCYIPSVAVKSRRVVKVGRVAHVALLVSLAGGAIAGVQAKPVGGKGKGREVVQDVLHNVYSPAVYRGVLPVELGDLKLETQRAPQSIHRRTSNKLQKRGSSSDPQLPPHYEWKNGEWVQSDDWSLNGRQGKNYDSQPNDPVASTSENTADVDDDGTDDLEGDDGTSESSIGWARTTNAVLGVDVATSGVTSVSPTQTTTDGGTLVPTHTNLSTFTNGSSATASASTPSATEATASTTTSNTTQGQTYDFTKDVPHGWISDGRTAAYAVPVIIGISIFLACLICSLIIIFVRSTKKRRRRKQSAKLAEEGKSKKLELPDEDGHFPGSSMDNNGRPGAIATALDGAMALTSGRKGLRKLGRRWSPANNPNGSLRRRRKDIAKLFNRKNGPVVVEEVSRDEDATALSSHATSGTTLAGDRTSGDGSGSAPVRTLSSNSIRSLALSNHETVLSQSEEAAPSSPTSDSSLRRSQRPTSIHFDTPPPLLSPATPIGHTSNDANPVPVPLVGPPAYIRPPTPAYTRSVDGYLAGPPNGTPGSLSTASTPGFASNVDEKRSLLAGGGATSGGTTAAGGSSDPYREQRRYEHLYASREGDEEQRSSAACALGGSASAVSSQEGEVQASLANRLAGHIAVDDKELLGRIQGAGSAPDRTSRGGSSATQEASAPSLDQAEEAEYETAPSAPPSSSQAPFSSSSSASRFSNLPQPPRALLQGSFARLSSLPAMDEKTRMRQMEAEEAAFHTAREMPSAPPGVGVSSAPSAPPSAQPSAPSAPSAPDLGDEEQGFKEASAPVFVLEDEEVDVDQDSRPRREGIV